MAAADYITALYNRHWQLLEAHTPWASIFGANNRIKLTADVRNPFKDNHGDSDYPEFSIGLPALADSGYSLTPGYNYTAAATGANTVWKEQLVLTYPISIVTVDLRLGQAAAAVLETLTALRKGGPRWQLSYLKSWGPIQVTQTIAASAVDAQGNPAGVRRVVTTLQNPCTLLLDGSALIV